MTPEQRAVLARFRPDDLGLALPRDADVKALQNRGLIRWIMPTVEIAMYDITDVGRDALAQ